MTDKDEGNGPQSLLILGAGRFAVEVAELIGDVPTLEVAAFAQNADRSAEGVSEIGLPVLWLDDLADWTTTHRAVCAVGSAGRRKLIERAVEIGFSFATVVHPSAYVSASVRLHEGALLSAGAIVAAHTSIGRHVIVNRGALIGHHTEIGDFANLGPGANIAGSCVVGASAQIGMGATILDHISIGENAVVGAGSVVTRNVPAGVRVLGVPARVSATGSSNAGTS